jgi:hypothetical protein
MNIPNVVEEVDRCFRMFKGGCSLMVNGLPLTMPVSVQLSDGSHRSYNMVAFLDEEKKVYFSNYMGKKKHIYKYENVADIVEYIRNSCYIEPMLFELFPGVSEVKVVPEMRAINMMTKDYCALRDAYLNRLHDNFINDLDTGKQTKFSDIDVENMATIFKNEMINRNLTLSKRYLKIRKKTHRGDEERMRYLSDFVPLFVKFTNMDNMLTVDKTIGFLKQTPLLMDVNVITSTTYTGGNNTNVLPASEIKEADHGLIFYTSLRCIELCLGFPVRRWDVDCSDMLMRWLLSFQYNLGMGASDVVYTRIPSAPANMKHRLQEDNYRALSESERGFYRKTPPLMLKLAEVCTKLGYRESDFGDLYQKIKGRTIYDVLVKIEENKFGYNEVV